MKKVIITVIAILILNGCSRTADETIDHSQHDLQIADFKVVKIKAPAVISHSGKHTAITTSVEVDNSEPIKRVWFEIEAAATFSLTDELKLEMKDDGDVETSGDLVKSDNIFTGRYVLTDPAPNRKYWINYYYEGPDKLVKQIGRSSFDYFPASELEVIEINAPSQITYTDPSTHFKATVEVNVGYPVTDIWYEIQSSDGNFKLVDSLSMKDDGNRLPSGDEIPDDNIFTAQQSLGIEVPNGTYTVKYFMVKNPQDAPEEIGTTSFTYNNSQLDRSFVISDPIIPNQIARGVTLTLSIEACDKDNLDDIQSVSYELYRPNGELFVNAKGISFFPLFDSGDLALHNDKTADDGIYTAMLTFPKNEKTGEWTFIFYAKDRANKVINEIIHVLEVQ